MKKQYIITEAKQIKKYVEQHKKIPLTNQFADGTIYSIYTSSTLLSQLIKDWNKASIDPYPVIIYNQKTYKDTINEKVMKDDYLKMIQNFLTYCKQNRRVPTYITTQKSRTKVSFELFTYCLSKIVVYLAENNTLPNYCEFKANVLSNAKDNREPSKKNPTKPITTCTNPYNSKTGCDAMGQNNGWYCGVSALQKSLYKLGIKNVTQKQLASACATTTAGTSHNGIRTGVAWASKKYNVKLSMKEDYFSNYTLKQLQDILCNPKKAIICHSLYRGKYGHYESWKSIDVTNKTIDVINSLGTKCSLGCYCGYIEKRAYATQKQYCNGISQKSLLIISKE